MPDPFGDAAFEAATEQDLSAVGMRKIEVHKCIGKVYPLHKPPL